MQDSIANYKVTFLNGIFGFMMAASMAFYSVHGKNSLSKVCLFFISMVLLYVKGPFTTQLTTVCQEKANFQDLSHVVK